MQNSTVYGRCRKIKRLWPFATAILIVAGVAVWWMTGSVRGSIPNTANAACQSGAEHSAAHLDRAGRLLSFGLRLHLLDLLVLILDFLLLLLYLLLGLRVGIFLVLHRIANYVASATAHNTADRGARERMTYGCAYDCPSPSA